MIPLNHVWKPRPPPLKPSTHFLVLPIRPLPAASILSLPPLQSGKSDYCCRLSVLFWGNYLSHCLLWETLCAFSTQWGRGRMSLSWSGQRSACSGLLPNTRLFENQQSNTLCFEPSCVNLAPLLVHPTKTEVAVLMVYWDCLWMIGLFYSYIVILLHKTVSVR